MIITIKELLEESKGEAKWLTVTDENAKKHRLFPNKIEGFKEKVGLVFVGSTVELVKKKNGEYWDVVDIKQSSVSEAIQKDQSADFAISAKEDKSKITSMSVSYIKDLRCAGAPIPFILYAKALLWISKGLDAGMTEGEVENFLLTKDSMFKLEAKK